MVLTWIDAARQAWCYTHLSAAELEHGKALAQASRPNSFFLEGASHIGWKSWALTDVVYRQQNVLSKLFGIASFIPVALMFFLAGLASAPCRQRRIPALNLILYFVLSVMINVGLKATLRSRRPAHPAVGMRYTTANGMPSDHSQFMAGLTVYLLRRCDVAVSISKGQRRMTPPQRSGRPSPLLWWALLSFLTFASLFVSVGRVYNGFHTVGQVVVGWFVGVILAYICTTPLMQRGLTWCSERALVPVMLVCTFWTDAIC